MTTKGNWHQVLRILLWLSCSSNIWPNWIPSIFLFENSFPLSSVHLVYLVSDVDPYEMGEFVSSVRIPSQSDSWFSMIEGHLQFLSWVRHIHNVFQISMSRPKLLAYMQLRPRKILFIQSEGFLIATRMPIYCDIDLWTKFCITNSSKKGLKVWKQRISCQC